MATFAPGPQEAGPLEVDERVWRMPVERYHEMVQSGALGADDRIELLEGVLVEKMSKNPPHVYSTMATMRLLNAMVPAGWHLRSQDPVTLADSEPEPDLMVVRGDGQAYLSHHPHGSEIGLVVEVADSSLRRDRGIKKRIYARAGIPVYWLIDLASRTVEVYTGPQGSDYAVRQVLEPSQELFFSLDGQLLGRVAVSQILPPASDTPVIA